MGKWRINAYPSEPELARAVAREWLERIQTFGTAGLYSVALSGGRIAPHYLASLGNQAQEAGTPLSHLHFFWADERCVPPASAESNYRLAQAALFEPLGIEPAQQHRIRGELDPETAARAAGEDLEQTVAARAQGVPVIDLVILGMGEDGHIASLFPGSESTPLEAEPLFYPVVAAKPPPQRITMSYRLLVQAREVWTVISGSGKEQALRASLSETVETPFGRLLQLRRQTQIFTDLKL